MKPCPAADVPLAERRKDEFKRFYRSAVGKIYAAKYSPFSFRNAASVLIYELKPNKSEHFLGSGLVRYDAEKEALYVEAQKSEESATRIGDRVRVRKTRGIQLFLPVVEFALFVARSHGIHRLILTCNSKMAEYYAQFGFKVSEPIYEHEHTGRIIGYEMQFLIK